MVKVARTEVRAILIMGGIMEYLDTFFQQYLETALWSSTDDQGKPMDDTYSVSDISEESKTEAREQCQAFISLNAKDLEQHGDAGQAGHDFWLTRNGHGAGFWDRGLGDLGDRLSAASKSYGESDLYIGDDGRVHIS